MKKIRLAFQILCALTLFSAFIQVARADEHAVPPQAQLTAPNNDAVARELEEKRVVLEAKQQQVDEQELRLKEREKEIERKLKEMERLRAEVSGELDEQRKAGEEKVAKVVSVLETMTPKAASALMETLDDWLSVDVFKRMDTKRVAKIMNLMDKNRSAKLSELMTGYYHPEADRKVSSVKPGQAPPPKEVHKEVAKAAVPAPAAGTKTGASKK